MLSSFLSAINFAAKKLYTQIFSDYQSARGMEGFVSHPGLANVSDSM